MGQSRALIAGITGQDGSYLADLLLAKNYKVYGLTRNISCHFSRNIQHLEGKIELIYCPYTEFSIMEAIQTVRPQEVYNFSAQSYVGKSWNLIPETVQNTGVVPTFFLEAILKIDKSIKFFQASSGEIFSPSSGEILTERSLIEPSSPYGCSKAFAHQMVTMFRKYHGVHFLNGILFNHESPRRNDDFLSKKITRAAVAIKLGNQRKLVLGNLHAARDWGYAPDYMDAVYRMMQLRTPSDLIVSTGKLHTVEDMVRIVFDSLDLNWKQYINTDSTLMRPFENPTIFGSHEKLTSLTGWKPSASFEEMLRIMVDEEMKLQQRGTA